MSHAPIIIIGGGPAGYTAAIYAARANLSPLQFDGETPGGQLMLTTDVENYPGFRTSITGPSLMEDMRAQAQHVGTTIISENITNVDLSKRPFTLTCGKNTYTCDTLIIATGARARWLGLDSERDFMGYGVSACATCDGFFYKNKRVAVVGGGNAAVEEALYLTHHASHVTLIHRRDTLRAEKIAQDRLLNHPKISVLWNTQVHEINGDTNPRSVTHVTLQNTADQSLSRLDVDGIFVAIGHDPESRLFKGQVDLDADNYIVTKPGTTQTSIPGVFAAGDVQDKIFRQAITAAGQGCMAALEAERFLSH